MIGHARDKVDTNELKAVALEIGFDLVGITSAEPLRDPAAQGLKEYLAQGRHGEMAWLARNWQRRLDPASLLPGARSVICTAVSYSAATAVPPAAPVGRIARYARGRDYHLVLGEMLNRLADRIKSRHPHARIRACVDTSAILEKALAARAGLGWIGKNSLLVNERLGSWLVLGELITDLDLAADQPIRDRCGSCTRCLDACPTRALPAPRQLDARRCLSWWTVESRRDLPPEYRRPLDDRILGCDACQEACPFNEAAQRASEQISAPAESVFLPLRPLLNMNEGDFRREFAGSSLLRPGLAHLQHLARICLANAGLDRS